MYKILESRVLAEKIIWHDVYVPRIAASAKPGQFLIVKLDENGERIPLTICGYDKENGTISIVVQSIGESTEKFLHLGKGDSFTDVVGPLGRPSDFIDELEETRNKKILIVAGGLGAAPVYPQIKWLHEHGIKADCLIGARTKDLVILKEEIGKVCENLYIATDDGTDGFHGNTADAVRHLVLEQKRKYDEVIAIGPMIMMKFVCIATKELGIKTIVSMNTIMVDGTGMCGACRLTVGDEVKFACTDGPEFDGHLIDFDEAMRRARIYKDKGKEALDDISLHPKGAGHCPDYQYDKRKRVPIPVQDADARSRNFEEVTLGYSLEQAKQEASRCLNCKNAKCIDGCPVKIDIPRFIQHILNDDLENAYATIAESNSLPAVCGRVCPQETQCEQRCIVGIKGESVGIGRLERFVGDYALEKNLAKTTPNVENNGIKVGIIGSGPAGLSCASTLANLGYSVTIFEALHQPGGVLAYGIPEFRLPKDIVGREIDNVTKLGVNIETNVLIGRTMTLDEILEDHKAVFIGTGAGLPKFMNIPGENANGVFSANEYLTRANLMQAYKSDTGTPISIGKKVCVVGGGNVAMDAARTARRFGSEVHIIYRRGKEELPARLEEVHHAEEEGIIFDILTNPVEILMDKDGYVTGMKCIGMSLGDPDESGRKSPQPVEGSEFVIDCDTVLMSLGTTPNPLVSRSTENLDLNKRGCVVINHETGETSKKGVFAGGDSATGAATVILAMGAGRIAAKHMDEYIRRTV